MASFGQLFKEAIAEQGLTTYGLAKDTGLDRSFIQGFFTGRKKLPYNQFNKIINSTYFSQSQIDELLDKYFEEKFGIDKLNRLKYINSVFTRRRDEEFYEEIPYEKTQITPNRLYRGRKSIISLICTVLGDSPRQISTNFSFYDYEINSAIYSICKSGGLNSFFHFVYRQEKTDNSKLEIVFNSLSYAEIGYLTHISDEPYPPSFMPYFILTDKYFIRYDEGVQNAYVMDSPEILSFARDYVDERKKHFSCEIQIAETALESMQIIQSFTASKGHESMVGIDSAICATYLNLETANSIVTPFIKEQPGVIQSLFAHYNLMLGSGVEEKKPALGMIITFEALDDFIGTGRIHSLPEEYARPLSKKQRADYLELLINDESTVNRLTNRTVFQMDLAYSFQINDTGIILCSCPDLNAGDAFMEKIIYATHDIQTVNDFYDYYRYIAAGTQTFNEEKTRQIIQSLIDVLRADCGELSADTAEE